MLGTTIQEKGRIIFIGDSILDDHLYLDDKTRDLTKEVSSLGFIVDNYAVDGSKLKDLYEGIKPSKECLCSRSYKYPIGRGEKVYQMELLNNKPFTPVYDDMFNSSSYDMTPEMVVISIGGNDLRADMVKIVFGVTSFFNSVVTEQYTADYENIIITSKENGRKVLLTSIYLPYIGAGSMYGMFGGLANDIVEKWKEFIIMLAKKHDIPVLDLSQIFDHYNREHYGSSELRSNNITNKCIAQCINYIHNNYNGFGIYSAPKCDFAKIYVSK